MTIRSLIGSIALGVTLLACGGGGSAPADAGQNGNAPQAICGNGQLEEREECDDGALNSDVEPDACRTGCRVATCGDGVTDTGEACDDGAFNSATDANACRPGCVAPRCGDGIVDSELGDACDCGDGTVEVPAACTGPNTDDPTASCLADCRVPGCGDGILAATEECDEGELNSSVAPNRCRRTCRAPSCGDLVIDDALGETCDAGPANAATPNAPCRPDCTPRRCGDGIQDDFDGEACDQGAQNGEAPNQLCRSDCQPLRCGDGIVDDQFGEECDGTPPAAPTCEALGFTGGIMGCGSDCLPDPSPCLNCGNGVCDAGDRALTCPAECVVTDLAAGASATCGLRVDGTVWCWGSNYLGRLGNNSLDDSPVPVQVVDEGGFGLLTGVTDLDFGSGHGCAVKADGTVWCWGDNGWGALGDGSNQNRSSPVQVTRWLGALLEGVVAASTGTHHACALRGDGSVWCWGLNSRGQLGRNTQHGSLNTADFYAGQVLGQDAVGYLTDVTQVEAGEAHACAVRSDGSLWCWGGNVYGELGDGTTTDRLTPVPVLDPTGQAPLGDVVQVSAASSPHTYERHTCALTGAGAVYCWGINESGQLGDGTQTERHLPVRVRNAAGTGFLDDVVEISAGQTSTCAVNGSGTVLCWGYNGCGQLGDGTTIARALPSEVLDTDGAGPLTDVAAVSAGTLHTCARKVDGTVYCWGHGLEGELGNGEASSSSTPLPTLDWP